MKKKITTLLLCFFILFSLSACVNNSSQETDITGEKKEQATISNANPSEKQPTVWGANLKDEGGGRMFAKETLALSEDNVLLQEAVRIDNSIFLLGIGPSSTYYLFQMDTSTHEAKRYTVLENSPVSICEYPEGSISVLSLDDEGKYQLSQYADGAVASTLELPSLDLYDNDFILHITAVEKGFVIRTTSKIVALDSSGNFIKELGDYYSSAVCIPLAQDGFLIAMRKASSNNAIEGGTVIQQLDNDFNVVNTYRFQELYTCFFADDTNPDHSILAQSGNILFRLDYTQNTREGLVDTFSSGMRPVDLIQLDTDFYFSINDGKPVLWSPANTDGLTVVSLATYNINPLLAHHIKRYNEEGRQYRINVIDYSIYDSTENDSLGLTLLTTDIISGNTPDLYDLSNLPAEKYAANGLFEDLLPFFSEGEALSSNSLVPSALQALELNKHLYYITPSFQVLTLCGDKSMVGKSQSWTIDEFLAMASSADTENIFGPEMTRYDFLAYVLLFLRDEYIDKETGTCRFDDPSFQALLSFAAKLPSEYDPNDPNRPDSQSWARAFTGNQILLLEAFGSHAISWMSFADTIYNGEAQFVGFPGNSGNGVALYPAYLTAVSANSSKKDGALDFISFILSDNCQSDSTFIPDCPVVEKYLYERLNFWVEKYNEIPPVLYSVFDDMPIEIPGETDPEKAKDRFLALVDKIDCLACEDDALYKIIAKECEAFFSGAIPVENACSNIQSKVKLYVSEQYG